MSRHVVVIGGGFGGLFTIRGLRGAPVEVTLIDRAAHHLFQPLLYQVATGVLSEGQIAVPLRDLMRRHANVESLLAEVSSIDVETRTVHGDRPGGGSVDVSYDDL